MPRPISDSTRREIRRRYTDGEGPSSIARQLDVSLRTVLTHTRSLPRQRVRITTEIAAEIHDMAKHGHRRDAIAEKLGISHASVAKYDPRRSPMHQVTPEAKAQILTMLDQAAPFRTIAATTGYSITTIRRYARERQIRLQAT